MHNMDISVLRRVRIRVRYRTRSGKFSTFIDIITSIHLADFSVLQSEKRITMGENLLILNEFKLLCASSQFKINYVSSACQFTALLSLKIIYDYLKTQLGQ